MKPLLAASAVTAVALAVLASSNALAVPVKKCPRVITASIAGIQLTKSLDEVLKEGETGFGSFDDKVAAVRGAYVTLQHSEELERTFFLEQAKHNRCVYRGLARKNEEKIELYTKGGKYQAYLQAGIGAEGILVRAFMGIAAISPESITLSSNAASLALAIPRSGYDSYSAGGPLVFVGRAAARAEGHK